MFSKRTLALFGFSGLCGTLLLIAADPAESLVAHTPKTADTVQLNKTLASPTPEKAAKTKISSRYVAESSPTIAVEQSDARQQDGVQESVVVPNYLFGENVVLEIETLDYANLDEIQIGTECQIGDLTVYKANRIQPSELQGQSELTVNTREFFYEDMMDRSQDVECQTLVAYQYQSNEQDDVMFTLEQELSVQYLAH